MINPRLEVRDLRFFLAVGEELHFRRAAERLGIAQPHLSLHIRQLEERLGVPLLERTTRSVRLTKAGERFLERARYVLTQVEESVTSTRHFAEGRLGQLKIGFTPAAGFTMIPWVLRECRQLYPDVTIHLSQKNTAAQVRELIEGRLHFGFVRLPVHSRRLSTLTLSREGVVAALPRDHPMAARSPLALEDLANEDFVYYAPLIGVDFQESIVSYCHRAGFSPKLSFEASDTNAIVALVAAGYGVALLPEWSRKITYPHVVFKTIAELPKLVELAVAWLPDDPAPAHRAFREVIERFLRVSPLD